MRPWPLLLLVPLVSGGVLVQQEVAVDTSTVTPPATLVAGTGATLGSSLTSADVSLPIPVGISTILELDASSGWEMRAEWVSDTFGNPSLVTVSIDDGLPELQIKIDLGLPTVTTGTPVALPTLTDAAVTVTSTVAGSMVFDLVLSPTGSDLELRYRVDLTVTPLI